MTTATKVCKTCQCRLPHSSFFTGTRRNGRTYTRKACRKCKNRAETVKFTREESPVYRKKRDARHSKTRLEKYPEKEIAKRLLHKAIKSGLVSKKFECEHCGKQNPHCRNGSSAIQGHHYKGYDYPLDVLWLCIPCHYKEHKVSP